MRGEQQISQHENVDQSGSLSLRRHYPEQVIRVFLSFDLTQSTPGESLAGSLASSFLTVNEKI
jgi:hypothetical protein